MTPGALERILAGSERQRELWLHVLRALTFTYLGERHRATQALARAIADRQALPAAFEEFEGLPTLPQRKILTSFAALCWPTPPRRPRR